MLRIHRTLAVVGAAFALAALLVVPSLAQEATPPVVPAASSTTNTITVTGTGSVHGAPDIATVDVGVDVFKPTVDEAFSEANTKAQAIIDAIKALGVADEDIQTSNLSVYSTNNPNPETGNNEPGYTVSNTVHVIVRDVSKAANVIDAAIKAGATTLYGLNFDISDRGALETQARELAMQDAEARAGEYASLAKGTLGAVVSVVEGTTGNIIPVSYSARAVAAPGAALAAGQTEVQIQVTVSYQLVR
jgi:uncharacterized protein YggE